MKAGAIALGKKVFPVSSVFVAPGMEEDTDVGKELRIVCTGLYPRNAAKSADVGETFLKAGIS